MNPKPRLWWLCGSRITSTCAFAFVSSVSSIDRVPSPPTGRDWPKIHTRLENPTPPARSIRHRVVARASSRSRRARASRSRTSTTGPNCEKKFRTTPASRARVIIAVVVSLIVRAVSRAVARSGYRGRRIASRAVAASTHPRPRCGRVHRRIFSTPPRRHPRPWSRPWSSTRRRTRRALCGRSRPDRRGRWRRGRGTRGGIMTGGYGNES